MAEAGSVELVVQSDDFGMCHAVNRGVERAFTEGILTQVSTMVPCPWFDEAAELARTHGIPAGMHSTLTCEWDYLRWGPLTGATSLAGADRTFHRTVLDARASATVEDATAELIAQAERFLATGLELTHIDCHMGAVSIPAYEAVCARFGQRFIYPGINPSYRFTSIAGLSDRDAAGKKSWLLERLEGLAPGVHLLVTHCAEPGEEMSSITAPSSEPWRWAEEYRASDLATLTDPEVRRRIDDLGIQLRSVADATFPDVSASGGVA
jgi:predicted glycoside hydrolase/deacetylase ChbG (UPF0249 family)